MSRNPKVSIIIPVYNSEEFINSAYHSILKQSFTSWEIIFVDDGSNDNSKKVIHDLIESSHNELKYYYQDNKGADSARNLGIKNSSTDYIAFHDIDDTWTIHHLRDCVESLDTNPKVDIVFGPNEIVEQESGQVIVKNTFHYDEKPLDMLDLKYTESKNLKIVNDSSMFSIHAKQGLFCGIQFSVYRKRVFSDSFFPELKNCGDILCHFVFIKQKYTYAYLTNIQGTYYIHNKNSVARNTGKKIGKYLSHRKNLVSGLKDVLLNLDLTKKEKKSIKSRIANEIFWDIGYNLFWQNNYKKDALKHFYKSFYYEFSIKKLLLVIKLQLFNIISLKPGRKYGKKDNILAIHYNPSSTGSFLQRVSYTLNNLSYDYNIILALPKNSNIKEYNLDNISTKTLSLTEPNNYLGYFLSIIKFQYFLYRNQIHLIYVLDYNYWKPAELLLASFLKIPIIAYITSIKEKGFSNGLIKSFNQVLCNSIATSKSIKISDEKLSVIPEFILPSNFTKTSNNNANFNIGFMGYLSPVKGVEYLIDAIQTLKNTHKNIICTIAGGIKDKEYFSKIYEPIKNDKTFKFISEVKDINEIYSSFDMLILPSISEGFGFVLLEATCYEMPIVATNVGGIPEVLGNLKNGIIVEPKDSEAIANAIDFFIKNPKEVKNYSEKGIENLKLHYNPKTIFSKVNQIIINELP